MCLPQVLNDLEIAGQAILVKVGKKEQPALETFLSPKEDEAGKKHQALVQSVRTKVSAEGSVFACTRRRRRPKKSRRQRASARQARHPCRDEHPSSSVSRGSARGEVIPRTLRWDVRRGPVVFLESRYSCRSICESQAQGGLLDVWPREVSMLVMIS